MAKYLTQGLVVICLGLAAVAWFWHGLAVSRGKDLQDAQARLSQVEQAAAVHRAHIERMQAEAARWGALEADLQSMEGRDAPLDADLAAAAGKLWRR